MVQNCVWVLKSRPVLFDAEFLGVVRNRFVVRDAWRCGNCSKDFLHVQLDIGKTVFCPGCRCRLILRKVR